MKEFDKIYLAKYENILTIRQLADDLKTSQKNIIYTLEDIKKTKMLDVYKGLSDWDWEKLENLKNDEIKFKYFRYSSYIQKKNGFRLI